MLYYNRLYTQRIFNEQHLVHEARSAKNVGRQTVDALALGSDEGRDKLR